MSVVGRWRILRRLTGAVGAFTGLFGGELFLNQVDNTLYVGYGDDGSGNSTGQVAVGGTGAFLDKASAQTVGGIKTFVASPIIPTPAVGDSSAAAAPTAFVTGAISTAVAPLAPKVSPNFSGSPTAPTPSFGDSSALLATTGFVQAGLSALAQQLPPKPTARLATAAALPANTYSNGVLTASANGALSVDGIAVAVSDIVLVKNEVTAANNGLYTVTNAGAAGAAYVLTRHVNMDVSAEVPGAYIIVGSASAGTGVNANSFWTCNPTTPFTLGTTAIPFTQLNGATDLIQSGLINISGNTVSVKGDNALTAGTLLKYDGTKLVVAVAGTDYVAPGTTYDSGTA